MCFTLTSKGRPAQQLVTRVASGFLASGFLANGSLANGRVVRAPQGLQLTPLLEVETHLFVTNKRRWRLEEARNLGGNKIPESPSEFGRLTIVWGVSEDVRLKARL